MSDDDAENGTTRERILEAAHRVFLRRGTAGARTQEIADEAGVNKAMLHYYFNTKEELSVAVFVRAARTLVPPVLRAASSDLPLDEKIRAIVEIEHEALGRNPFIPAFLISELNHHPSRAGQLAESVAGEAPRAAGSRVLARLQAQIDEGVEAGTLRPVRAEDLLVHVVSLCMFPFAMRPLLELILDREGEAFDELIDSRREGLADFILAGLRPPE
jgi:AcrR family transcriptional regulator